MVCRIAVFKSAFEGSKKMLHRIGFRRAVYALLSVSFKFVTAAPASADCKADLVDAMARIETHGPMEEKVRTIIYAAEKPGGTLKKVSTKNTITTRVPPDGFSFVRTRSGESTYHTVSIGNRNWTKRGVASWKEEPAEKDKLTAAAEEIAKVIADSVKNLSEVVKNVRCSGPVNGRDLSGMKYEYDFATLFGPMQSVMWIEIATKRPLRSTGVADFKDLGSRTELETIYRFDPAIRIEPPKTR